MRRSSKNNPVFAVVTFLFSFAGCVTEQFVCPDDFRDDGTDVILTTSDARRVQFFAGHYQVVGVDTARKFVGKGEEWTGDKRTTWKEFIGEVPFSQIVQIQTIEKTVFYYTGPILFGVAAASMVLVMILLNGRSFGG